ncbi:hypothetical protein J6590_086830 [Homalodisca vitripennis]|nr:hypothetical protein J6590_086830 [Homalodisca vitripennis]
MILQVTWLHRKAESINLLTVDKLAYSNDMRITLNFRYPNNFRLRIGYVNRRDEGLYECQVATFPPKVKQVFLKVTAPEVFIKDEKNHVVTERYYKAGSAVDLTCLASHIETPGDNITWWREDLPVQKGVSYNSSVGPGSVASTLVLHHAQKRHSGNYTCSVNNLASASVSVHILNGEMRTKHSSDPEPGDQRSKGYFCTITNSQAGELPAAVHDGSSGTVTCCLSATWLLTLCCLSATTCVTVIHASYQLRCTMVALEQ